MDVAIHLPFSSHTPTQFEVVAFPDNPEDAPFTVGYLPRSASEGDTEFIFCDSLDDLFVFEFRSGAWHDVASLAEEDIELADEALASALSA